MRVTAIKQNFLSGAKCLSIIQNNEHIVNSLESVNKRNKGNTIPSFDFYIFNELINIYFKAQKYEFIAIDKKILQSNI